MSGSDAILIGEGWISEHYFTTDATSQSFKAQVIARRKLWDGQKDTGSTRSRFTAVRGSMLSRLASLEDDPDLAVEIRKDLIDALGYNALGLISTVSGPVTFVRQASLTDGPGVAVIAAVPVETADDLLEKDVATLAGPYDVDDSTQIHSVSRLLSTLFVEDDAPDFALVLAGRIALVAERGRWPEGRYLAIDLQLVSERNDDKRGGETDTALACISAESLAPDAEGSIWWHSVLEESINHTVGVSQDLRDGVRLSIEIIANDVVTRRANKGLTPLPDGEAQPLAKQSLRFLYRILFLLYAEASPELAVLPTGATEYDQGYSLDRLRDLIQTPLTSNQAESGTHLYESLSVLFNLVDKGYTPTEAEQDEGLLQALTFRSLKADLFRPEATALIDEVKLSNVALQRVLQHLLLSKEKRGSDRGFISYAELGINQLGAVYEGLMSYTGRFAASDLFEVAKGGDASKGSWLVPVDRAAGIDDNDFVRYEDPITSERKPVLHKTGSFVFRLAGRERQQSASYYTPEVLTKFTVGQALEELLDQGDMTTSAEDILSMTVCEPALGSGAFAIEAVRQLAAEYLSRRQDELGERIDPEEYPKELQRVKAYLALHNVYGVDLNSTAVELAEISLWLDTMMEGLQAPWFGLHLRRGNSLIGARHAVYERHQVAKKRAWLQSVPQDLALTDLPGDVNQGREGAANGCVHHFLLPAEGWGSAIKAKEAKELAPEALEKLKQWRKQVLVQPTKSQVDALVGLGRRVEALWQLTWRRLSIAESEVRRSIDVWGAEDLPVGGAVTREQIEQSLTDPNGAYRRLRRVMDAWCAMWFWPLTEETAPPTLDEWIVTLQQLLGRAGKDKKQVTGQFSLVSAANWGDLGIAEEVDLSFAGVRDVSQVLVEHPWLAAAERVAAQQGFFHWELDFAPVFACGGFDLQVGNPPWVRPRLEIDAVLAEGDPWWQLASKATIATKKQRRIDTLAIAGIRELVLETDVAMAATGAFLGSGSEYPLLGGLQPDLYRCFMARGWKNMSGAGVVAFIHPETHFTDEGAGALRREAYLRLRRHWQFINSLLLFEIKDNKRYGVHIYAKVQPRPHFMNAAWLYHPDTVTRSLKHDGSGQEPGMRTETGEWNLQPHLGRITEVDTGVLSVWRDIREEPESDPTETRMIFLPNRSSLGVLSKMTAGARLGSSDLEFATGWTEGSELAESVIDIEWGERDSWQEVVLQGSHLFVGNPFYQKPNATMRSNQDWSPVDLEGLGPEAIPVCVYKPTVPWSEYKTKFGRWGNAGEQSPLDYYRIAWRNMADNVGQRTFVPAIIPPGAAHVHNVASLRTPGNRELVLLAGALSSLLIDNLVRSAPKSNIRANVISKLPAVQFGMLSNKVILRVLRLNCLTGVYARLWAECYTDDFLNDSWASEPLGTRSVDLSAVPESWNPDVPLRRAIERRQAEVEIDALVAIALGVSADELVSVYSNQFPVLVNKDRDRYLFDAHGRMVPAAVISAWKRGQEELGVDEIQRLVSGDEAMPTLPFRFLDRAHDLRLAHDYFSTMLQAAEE